MGSMDRVLCGRQSSWRYTQTSGVLTSDDVGLRPCCAWGAFSRLGRFPSLCRAWGVCPQSVKKTKLSFQMLRDFRFLPIPSRLRRFRPLGAVLCYILCRAWGVCSKKEGAE
eukprot:5063137-Amphidinium_carterae.4